MSPDFCEQLHSCSVVWEDGSLLPTLCSQLQGRGKMALICLPMNAFWEERDLCAWYFPLDRNLERGVGSISVSFYCFTFWLFEKILPPPSKLKSRAKKKKNSHYYSLLFPDQKQLIQKFRMGRNLQKHPMIASVFHLIPADSVSREVVWKKKEFPVSRFFITLRFPLQTHTHIYTHTQRTTLYIIGLRIVQVVPAEWKQYIYNHPFVNTYSWWDILHWLSFFFNVYNPIFSFNKAHLALISWMRNAI